MYYSTLNPDSPQFTYCSATLGDVHVHKDLNRIIRVVGDLAYEVGIEYGQVLLAGEKVTIEHRVTNIYKKEGGAWKMVHHHTDISPAMTDVLRRLQAKAA